MKGRLSTSLGLLRRLVTNHCEGGLSDAQLLQRFAAQRDEAAFEVLVWRHGSMVLGVGRRVLRNVEDAEDILQATFLALARQAKSISRGEALAGWLYKVAYRIALRVKDRRPRRFDHQVPIEEVPERSGSAEWEPELWPVLDEELHWLPAKYRTPLILSYLQGLTNQEIATQLACPIGTVFTRLARGRDLLRKRLLQRGVRLASGLIGIAAIPGSASAMLTTGLVQRTIQAALAFVAGSGPIAGVLSPHVLSLTQGVCKMMWLSRIRLTLATLMVLLVVGSGVGVYAWQSAAKEKVNAAPQAATNAAAIAREEQPDAGPQPNDEQDKANRPRIVEVSPANGAADVEPVTEIRIRFDRPMDRTTAGLFWDMRQSAGFRPRGELRYVEATHEFVLPVQLSPGAHQITVNRESYSQDKEFDGFRSDKHVAAKPHTWSFRAKEQASKAGKSPRATSVAPTSDTEIALITPIDITFDQPMNPQFYGLSMPGTDTRDFDRQPPALLGRATYDANQHRFTLLVRLPPNWNGEVSLEGFQSKEGMVAQSIRVKYRTLRTPVSDATRKQIEQAGKSAELKHLVERIRKARKELTSVTEEVLTSSSFGSRDPNWLQMLETKGSRFQMMEPRKFLANIDAVMGIPYRIGSDGTTCWIRRKDERISMPTKDIEEKNILFCDPFDATDKADADQVIGQLKLEYLGEATVRGRRCYHMRSWEGALSPGEQFFPILDWYFDVESLLPIRQEQPGNGTQTADYIYSRINQKIPDEEFRPDNDPGAKVVGPDPLEEGYTKRFLNVIDGTNGRMSVRWGMKGPKGMSSSGLN